MSKKKSIITAAVAAAFAVGAAGLVVVIAPASADQQKAKVSTSASATASTESVSISPRTARGTTVVRFTESGLAALAPLSPKGLKPGAFGFGPYGLSVQAVFPIVGSPQGGIIKHAGGLSFTDGERTLVLRNYVINANDGLLTAKGSVNGISLGRVPFLTVAITAPAQGCDVSADLAVAAPAAQALTKIFGAADLTGAPIGTACITLR